MHIRRVLCVGLLTLCVLGSTGCSLLTAESPIDIRNLGTLGTMEEIRSNKYTTALAEKVASTAEGIDKAAVIEKAYSVLKFVDKDTKVTPEMISVVIMLAGGETPDTITVLKAVLPAETVEKLDLDNNTTVAAITEKLSDLKTAIDNSDKSAITDGLKKLQELIDSLKQE